MHRILLDVVSPASMRAISSPGIDLLSILFEIAASICSRCVVVSDPASPIISAAVSPFGMLGSIAVTLRILSDVVSPLRAAIATATSDRIPLWVETFSLRVILSSTCPDWAAGSGAGSGAGTATGTVFGAVLNELDIFSVLSFVEPDWTSADFVVLGLEVGLTEGLGDGAGKGLIFDVVEGAMGDCPLNALLDSVA